MSRAPIPSSKTPHFEFAYRQVCCYVFPRDPLIKFAHTPSKSPFEAMEDIEILRFLEMGMQVRMVRLSGDSVPVDQDEDIPKVIQAIKDRNL